MIDLRNPPVEIQALAEPLRSLAVQHANEMLDRGVGFTEAIRQAVAQVQGEGAERAKETDAVPGGRTRSTGG